MKERADYTNNKRSIGSRYEAAAAEYLKKQGYRILEQNFCCRSGEIDIIAKQAEYLVFVEVKYRRNESCGNPLEAVDIRKQRRISKTALYYCMRHGYGDTCPCRFDVIAIENDGRLVHLENAFEFRE